MPYLEFFSPPQNPYNSNEDHQMTTLPTNTTGGASLDPMINGTSSQANGAAGGDSFQQNLAQLQQVSEEQQRKQMAMRMLSAKLGSEQNAAKEKPSQ